MEKKSYWCLVAKVIHVKYNDIAINVGQTHFCTKRQRHNKSPMVSATICWLSRENMAKGGGLCVANHTSPIDAILLACDRNYALVSEFILTELVERLCYKSPDYKNCEAENIFWDFFAWIWFRGKGQNPWNPLKVVSLLFRRLYMRGYWKVN